MDKFLKIIYALVIGVAAFAVTSCGDSEDEPGYDESQPIVGTWIVQEVSNPNYTGYYGQLLPDEEQWKADFIKQWTGKKLIFKANQIEKDVVWVDKFNENNPQIGNGDRNISYEISSVNETELIAYYTELVYNTTRKDRFSRITAHMVMKRK